jgi:hypothetical protein
LVTENSPEAKLRHDRHETPKFQSDVTDTDSKGKSTKEHYVRKGIGFTLIIASVLSMLLVLVAFLKLSFWLAPPEEKFSRAWKEDIQLLEKSGKLPKEWQSIKAVEMTGDNSPVQNWLPGLVAPIKKNPEGNYQLNVFLIHWLEDNRYGVVIQYHLVDLNTKNTIWEIGRTLKLGFVY